ncbi:MAG TPA: hypothetical protein VK860_09395 [Ilumatobacteraceae bacterium]|jgi:formate-dependent nitrite reductase membrane component NrfD|nr:hypothetical protein [Ilumatobacteraceae bacterium]
MLAANVWHWWIGIALVLLGIVVTVVLVAGYLATVTAKKYPAGKQQRAQHTDL